MLLPLSTPFPLGLSSTSIEAVALEVSPCGVGMQGPVLHADPAELMSALATAHVVASFVLFNGCRATRAFLSVGSDPQSIGKILSSLDISCEKVA